MIKKHLYTVRLNAIKQANVKNNSPATTAVRPPKFLTDENGKHGKDICILTSHCVSINYDDDPDRFVFCTETVIIL